MAIFGTSAQVTLSARRTPRRGHRLSYLTYSVHMYIQWMLVRRVQKSQRRLAHSDLRIEGPAAASRK